MVPASVSQFDSLPTFAIYSKKLRAEIWWGVAFLENFSQKVNIITQVGFEISYFKVAVQH